MIPDPFRPLRLFPKKTAMVCKEIMERWPTDGSLPPLIDDSAERRRIRELIRRAIPGGVLYRPDARLAAIMAMDSSEARDWRAHAVNVLAALPKPLPFEPLYALYQHFYLHKGLRNTVGGQYVHLATKPFMETDALSVFGESPVDGLAVAAFRYLHSVPALIQHFHLQRSAPLAIHAARACYTAAIQNPMGELEKPWLRAHAWEEICEALETHLTTDQERGGFLAAIVRIYGALSRTYLEVAKDPLLPRLFERITQEDMLGKPDERPNVWKFDHEIAALVNKFLVDKIITDTFNRWDSEPARKEFWRRAISLIESSKNIHEYKECKALAMKIRSIWFVEFGETGNACYPYGDKEYNSLHEQWKRLYSHQKEKPDNLKNKNLLYHTGYNKYTNGDKDYSVGDGRLLHMPSWYSEDSGWHAKFETYIEAFCEVALE